MGAVLGWLGPPCARAAKPHLPHAAGAAPAGTACVGANDYSAGVEIAVALEGSTAVLTEVRHDGHAGTAPGQAGAGRAPSAPERMDRTELPGRVAELEAVQDGGPLRWVWADTAAITPVLLPAGVRVRRCLDQRLAHAILRRTPPEQTWQTSLWDEPAEPNAPQASQAAASLFDDLPDPTGGGAGGVGLAEVLAEHLRQQEAVADLHEPGRMRLLLAAESAGSLIAAEMHADGLPWDRAVHNDLLTAALGPRPSAGTRPAKLETLAARIRTELGAPTLNPDSAVEVLRSLRAQGLEVQTTRKWELERLDHPAIGPLLEYKKLSRLLSANGWAWLDAWVQPATPGRQGRFRPDYVPGGVATGRWATSGGGALQLPKQVRSAVRADPGWQLVVADAAQIEPRVLAAMAGDEALARAGSGGDLYQGLVDTGVLPTRDHAKVAMLGALYGGTSGDSGALLPRLMRTYPRAIELVEQAARTGERGGVVGTWLGRMSPPPPQEWIQRQRRAAQLDAGPQAQRRAGREMREWGRFTRNFVVQGTAAEWAVCWLGEIRRRLRALGQGRAHLVFFLHDEVIVHTPAENAEGVAIVVHEAAEAAGALLFGSVGVRFPLSVRIVNDYAEAN